MAFKIYNALYYPEITDNAMFIEISVEIATKTRTKMQPPKALDNDMT